MSIVGIHKLHRQLAFITLMCMDKQENMIVGEPELRLILPLLKENMMLVFKNDSLKALSYMAYEIGDDNWQMDICSRIDELEGSMLL
jgi:hypothetical protein